MTAKDFEEIRVLRVISRMNIGGPAIQVTTLMNYLPKSEVTQLLITGECEEGELDYLEFNQIPLDRSIIKGFGRKISPLTDLRSLKKIRNKMKEFKPDIVHTHTFKAGLLGRIAALTLKTRPLLIHTFHGHLLHSYFTPFKHQILIYIERFLALKTDVLVTVGEKVMNDLIEVNVGNHAKYEVVPPGFPMDNLNRIKVNSEPSKSKQLKCAWIGRVVQIKAPERILEIARNLGSNEFGVTFLVAGNGPLKKKLQNQSELEGLPIQFLGWVRNVKHFLRSIDILILTSLNEGTPISIIEAQRTGVPVVSTDVGSVREIIADGKSGHVLKYDPHQFARLIESFAVDSEKLKTFSDEAIRFSSSKFAPERLANDYLRIYKNLISK